MFFIKMIVITTAVVMINKDEDMEDICLSDSYMICSKQWQQLCLGFLFFLSCLDWLPVLTDTHAVVLWHPCCCSPSVTPQCGQSFTCRKEKSLVCSIMEISRFPITISQPVYLSFIRLNWFSADPVVLRLFWVPSQKVTVGIKQKNMNI